MVCRDSTLRMRAPSTDFTRLTGHYLRVTLFTIITNRVTGANPLSYLDFTPPGRLADAQVVRARDQATAHHTHRTRYGEMTRRADMRDTGTRALRGVTMHRIRVACCNDKRTGSPARGAGMGRSLEFADTCVKPPACIDRHATLARDSCVM